MAQKLLHTADFDDSCDLEEVLGVMKTVDEEHLTEWPAILIEDGNGKPLNRAKLFEDTLTDGSKVYKIVLSGVKEPWCGHGQYDSGTCAECKSAGWVPKR